MYVAFPYIYTKLVDNLVCCGRKVSEIFCENMKVILFEDEEYKGQIFENYNTSKNLRVFM
jgi:hypothetical protein